MNFMLSVFNAGFDWYHITGWHSLSVIQNHIWWYWIHCLLTSFGRPWSLLILQTHILEWHWMVLNGNGQTVGGFTVNCIDEFFAVSFQCRFWLIYYWLAVYHSKPHLMILNGQTVGGLTVCCVDLFTTWYHNAGWLSLSIIQKPQRMKDIERSDSRRVEHSKFVGLGILFILFFCRLQVCKPHGSAC